MTNNRTIQVEFSNIAKKAGLSVVGIIFANLFGYAISAAITRNLGANQYGLYVLATQLTMLIGVVSAFGLPRGAIRYISFFEGKSDFSGIKGIILFGMKTSFLSGLLFGIILFFLSPLISTQIYGKAELIPVFRILAVAIPFSSLSAMILASLIGLRMIKYQVLIENIFRQIIWLSLLLLLFAFGMELTGTLWVFDFIIFLLVAMSLVVIFRKFLRPNQRLQPSFTKKKFLKFSFPLYLNEFFGEAMRFVPIYFLGIFITTGEVGIFNISYKISLLIVTLSIQAFAKIFGPTISGYYAINDRETVRILLKVTTRWIFTIGIFLFCLIILFDEPLLKIFGTEFAGGKQVLLLLMIAQLINAVMGPLGNVLIMSGRPNIVMKNTAIVLALMVVLAYFLIGGYGMFGAGLLILIIAVVLAVVRLVEVIHYEKMHPFSRSYYKSVVAGGVGFFVIWMLKTILFFDDYVTLFAGGMLYSLVFFSVLYLLRLDDEDFIVLNELKHSVFGKINKPHEDHAPTDL